MSTETLGSSFLICGAGRMDCTTSLAWMTTSDDNYGFGYYIFNEQAGTSTDPVIQYETLGYIIPAGKTVTKMYLAGITNDYAVTDIEISVYKRTADYAAGVDADGEDTETEIYRNFFISNTEEGAETFGGSSDDLHMRECNINHEFTSTGFLDLYLKPSGTLGATKQFRMTYTFVIE